ncbi:hypothetical protein ACIA8K_12460 [Catenuloplanes sp. NPDC051500]|uniref:hypothetical protein n=1 Tax=Catenuloplanes sp. NPDC051500 TaxID=3363959 RepID=UPI00378BCDF0
MSERILARTCTCGQPLHPGTVMRGYSPDDDAEYDAVVAYVGPVPAEPLHRVLDVVSDTHLTFIHRGELETWQFEAGELVRCGTAADVPSPCTTRSPACEKHRADRASREAQRPAP